MPVSIQVDWDKLKGSAEFIRKERERFHLGIIEDSERFKLRWIAQVLDKYLSGPRPERLGVVSNTLRSSISDGSQVTQEGNITTITVGTNVKYAPIHEFGFHGTVEVPAHKRVIDKVFGRSVDRHSVSVKSHSRKMNIRKRPFLSPARKDVFPELVTSIEKRLREIKLAE